MSELRRTECVVEEERFEYRGYPCVILFMDRGHRCGYIGIPKDISIDTDMIGCHGGVTYESYSLHLQDDEDRLWIGFDTAHCGDGRDIAKVYEYFGPDVCKYLSLFGGEVRTLEYCKKECMMMVDQVIELIKEGE